MRFSNLITAVDVHAEGQPGRVVTGGILDVPGANMFEKMVHLREKADQLRKLMLREPRGYPGACCNVLLAPTIPGADAGFVIMLQSEYPMMSGANTICVATVLIETGMVPVVEPVTELLLEAPGGLIRVRADITDRKVTRVTFESLPAFATHLDAVIEVPHLGTVTVDVAWGGMFCVIADGTAFGLRLMPDEARDIARIGTMIKAAANEQLPVHHPDNPTVASITGSVLTAPPAALDATARNAAVVTTSRLDWDDPSTWMGAIDRSPCGSATCARMAALHARGVLALGEDFVHEGILGTTFTGRLVRETTVGSFKAVVPELSGQAWITGFANYILEPSDPFPEGYVVADIWGRPGN